MNKIDTHNIKYTIKEHERNTKFDGSLFLRTQIVQNRAIQL